MPGKSKHGGKREGAGRPGRGASEIVRLRVTPDERARWQAAAERAGVSLSEWIRERCA